MHRGAEHCSIEGSGLRWMGEGGGALLAAGKEGSGEQAVSTL